MEEIEERALGLIRHGKDGILQNQLRLELGIDGRSCARDECDPVRCARLNKWIRVLGVAL